MYRFLLIALSICAISPAEKKPVTVDVLASLAPPPRVTPIWAPDGKRFAFVEERKLLLFDGQDTRELARLDQIRKKAPARKARERFDWQNRRVIEQPIQWFPKGDRLLIREGGDLFILDVSTRKLESLAATPEEVADPKLSPDGQRVSFRVAHDLYVFDIARRRATRLTRGGTEAVRNGELDWVYPEELGLETAHWWSPDSSQIAFLQFDVSEVPLFAQVDHLRGVLEPQRYPRPGQPNATVRLGVLNASGVGKTRWMDVRGDKEYLLARVYWSPDSRMLATVRLNRVQDERDVIFADVQSGRVRTIVHEKDPYWIEVEDHFRFLDGGRKFLLASERDGFRHLYLYSSDGKVISQITGGEWEVTAVAWAGDTGVCYVSTEASPLERQFYCAALDGSAKTRLSAETGTHEVSMNPSGEFWVDRFSSLSRPTRTSVQSRGADPILLREDKRAADLAILPAEIHNVKAPDGTILYARLIKPNGFQPERTYPVIVSVYGGPHAQNVRHVWAGADFDQVLAHRGYLVWQLDNRGTAGRGHEFASKVYRNLGAKEFEDQIAGVRYLGNLGFAATDRMGIFGWSYGGYMTLYALTSEPNLFRAGIAGAPVTDWRNYDTIYTERYMDLPERNPAGYDRSSPLKKAANVTARLMLVHNLQDDNVHFLNTVQMADALQRESKPFELMVYPQKTHGITGGVRRHWWEMMVRFFDESLR